MAISMAIKYKILTAFVIISFGILILSANTQAQEYNVQHTAINAAAAYLNKHQNCELAKTSRSGNWINTLSDDKTEVYTTGVTFTTRCEKKKPKPEVVQITWQAPTHREDGSELKPEEISHYILTDESGKKWETESDQITLQGIQKPFNFKLQVVDTNGMVSSSTSGVFE